MIENYMDYIDDVCMNIFNKDQINRMHIVLENSPRRKTLLTSPGLNPPHVTDAFPIEKNMIDIYPNPTKGHIYIDLNRHSLQTYTEISGYSLSGKMIFSKKITTPNNGIIEVMLPTFSHQDAFILHVIGGDFVHNQMILHK